MYPRRSYNYSHPTEGKGSEVMLLFVSTLIDASGETKLAFRVVATSNPIAIPIAILTPRIICPTLDLTTLGKA